MIGLQFAKSPFSGDSNHAATNKAWLVDGQKQDQLAPKISKRCNEKGMLILSTSVFDVMRFIPALNITEDELSQACNIFKEAFEEVAKEAITWLLYAEDEVSWNKPSSSTTF